MTWQSSLASLVRFGRQAVPAHGANRNLARRMFLESLEDRRVMATISLSTGGGPAGSLDVAEFSGGKHALQVAGTDVAWDTAIQADGKIVVVGSTSNGSFSDFAVARFNADGSPDTGFGTGGIANFDFLGGNDEARSVAIDSAGNIVVAGVARNAAGNDGNFDFALLRLTSTGILDTNFNSSGKVLTDFGGFEQGRDLAIQPDGKIVVVGHALLGSGVAFARYNLDGSPDTTFSLDGQLVLNLGFVNETLEAVAVQPGGKIVAGGTVLGLSGSATALVRVDSSGVPDADFGGDGIVVADIGGADVAEEINGLVLHNGGIVVAGAELNNSDVLLAGFDDSGNLNTTSFGVPGIGYVLTDNNGGNDAGLDVAVTGDNKLVVVGVTGFGDDFLVVRYLSSGLPDASFGAGAITSTDFAGDDDAARAVAIQPDGKIVAVGSTSDTSGDDDFAVARYLPEGSGGAPVITGSEGDSYTLTGTFSDPEVGTTHSIVIVWGDGTQQTVSAGQISGGTFTVPHVFADDSSLVTAKIVETANPASIIDTDSAVATIVNVAPVAAPITGYTTIVRGQSASLTGSFTDAGALDTHQIAWNFGDGSPVVWQPSTAAGVLTPSHVYAAAGVYNVSFTVKDDNDGQHAASGTVTVVIAQLQPAPCGCGTALVIGGTSAAESITVTPATGGGLQVSIDSVNIGTFSPSHAVVVHAYDGNDTVQVAGCIGLASWIYGGNGNDRLKGGSGHDMLQGQAGDDLLVGGAGRDLLIGGVGSDRIVGDSNDDILVAGTTSHDNNATALCHILAEWTSDRLYWIRAANLVNGSGAAFGINNGSYFLNDGTVQDDGVRDLLTGSSGIDLFYANLSLCNDDAATKDCITDLNWWEFAIDIDFISSP